jgi:hypothetical protein
MPIDRETFARQQDAAFAAVTRVISAPTEFYTADELIALLSQVPGDTPVSIAETVHIDPAVDLDAGTHCTAAAATSVILGNGPVEVLENGTTTTYEQVIPGIELGAYIVTQGSTVPAETVPFPLYDRSVHALDHGDLGAVFDADAELLQWIASQLTDDPDDTDASSIPSLLGDEGLRQELTIEGDRLRHAAARLETLRGRVLAQLDAESQPDRPSGESAPSPGS